MPNLTDEIYWASKPPEVRALQDISVLDQDARQSAAAALSAKGFLIDRQIDIWGWSPSKVMAYRTQLGATYSLDGISGLRTIKVSVDAADYPPFDAVKPPAPPVRAVGQYKGNGLYEANITACADPNGHLIFADGQHYTQDGVEYVFHVTQFWGMPSINWTKA